MVSDNPLRCGCAVSWVGAWLRRWTAEVGGWTHEARAAARTNACISGSAGDDPVPLVALDEGEAECHASALSSRSLRVLPPFPCSTLTMPMFLWMVLLHSVS